MKRSMLVVAAALAALVLLGAWRVSAPGARADDRRDEREREREWERERRRRERELEALEGVWKFIRYEAAGRPVEDGAKRAWIIREHRWAHREEGETSPECRLEIDPEDAPHHLDVWDGDAHVISAIYVRLGDIVILCGNRPADQGTGRPERFETGTPGGGLFMIACQIQPFDR